MADTKRRGFIYYFPGQGPIGTAARIDFLRQRGLHERVERGAIPHGVTGGPDGNSGWTVPSLGFDNCRYYKNEQEWVQTPDGYWIGWFRDAVPGPEDLAKPGALPGFHVIMGDGQKWLLPVARRYSGETSLPRSMHRNGEGGWSTGRVLRQYESLWNLSERVYRHLEALRLQGDRRPDPKEPKHPDLLSNDQMLDVVVELLSVNYRIGAAEVSALGLITDANFEEAALTVVDIQSIRELTRAMRMADAAREMGGGSEKKEDASMPAGSSSSSGGSGMTPTTPPPGPISSG